MRKSKNASAPERAKILESPLVEPPADSRGLHYLKLASIALLGAVVVAFALALLIPLSEPEPLPGADAPEEGVAASDVAMVQPTIALPAAAVDVTAESLQGELEGMASQLQARFPNVPEALHVAAMVCAEVQKTTEAERIWQKCIELAPDQVGPYVGLASVAMERGNDEAAVSTLEQARVRVQPSPEFFQQLGLGLTKLGRLDEARTALQQGVEAFPDSPEISLQLGQTQLQLGQFGEAEASLRRAIELGADPEAGWFALANACARQGKQEEAAACRARMAELKADRKGQDDTPFQSRYVAALRRIAVPTMSRAAMVYDRQGNAAEAERILLRAIALEPRAVEPYVVLGGMLRTAKRLGDLQGIHQRLVEIEPQNVVHYLNLASVSSQLGDAAAAEQLLQQVVELRPDAAIGYTALAQLYMQTNRAQQARWTAEAALRRQPTADGYLVLAAACQTLGDAAAAQAAVEEARRIAPEDPRWKASAESGPNP